MPINLHNTGNAELVFTTKDVMRQGTHNRPRTIRYFVEKFMPNTLSQPILTSLHIKIGNVKNSIRFCGKVNIYKRQKRLAVFCT